MERRIIKASHKGFLIPGDVLKRISNGSYCTLDSTYENSEKLKYFYFKDDFGSFSVNHKLMFDFFKHDYKEFILYDDK